MTQKSLTRILVLCLATFLMVAAALAQDHSSLTGKWSMTSETENDPVNWTLVLKDTDGKLTAALATEDGEVAAKEFTYDGHIIKFKTEYQGQDYQIELKVSGAALEGTWSGGGDSGRTHGTKAS